MLASFIFLRAGVNFVGLFPVAGGGAGRQSPDQCMKIVVQKGSAGGVAYRISIANGLFGSRVNCISSQIWLSHEKRVRNKAYKNPAAHFETRCTRPAFIIAIGMSSHCFIVPRNALRLVAMMN